MERAVEVSIPRSIAAGIAVSLIQIPALIAFAIFMFGEGLETSRAQGIGLFVLGGAIMATVGMMRTSLDGSIFAPQDAISSILALGAAGLVESRAAPLGDTVIALMIVSSLATGLVFLVLGRFRLGRFVRFVPFPVVAGFLAGVGILISRAAFDIAAGPAREVGAFNADAVAVWAPALAIVVILLIGWRVVESNAVMPLVMVLGLVIYQLVVRAGSIDTAEAAARGWLASPVPDGNLLRLDAARSLIDADYGAIAGEFGTILTVLLIAPLAMLFTTSGFEQVFARDIDTDAELTATGTSNLVGAAFGAPGGYAVFATSAVSRRGGNGSRIPAIVFIAASIAVLVFGRTMLGAIPRWLPAGLLGAIGIDLGWTWLLDVRRRVSRLGWVQIAVISMVVTLFGFLPGVTIGLLLASLNFMVDYSRLPAVRRALTLRHVHSNVQRTAEQSDRLDELGDRVRVFELSGYLFFGSAEAAVDTVRTAVSEGDVDAIIVDFGRVRGVDSTGVASFTKLVRSSIDADIPLTLASLDDRSADALDAALKDLGIASPGRAATLDDALEAVEDLLLVDVPVVPVASGLEAAVGKETAAAIRPYLVPAPADEGAALLRQGESSPGFVVLERGTASVWVRDASGQHIRIRRLGAGAILGDITAYLGGPCTTTVTMDSDGEALILSATASEELELAEPAVATAFHTTIAAGLAERLKHASNLVEQLK